MEDTVSKKAKVKKCNEGYVYDFDKLSANGLVQYWRCEKSRTNSLRCKGRLNIDVIPHPREWSEYERVAGHPEPFLMHDSGPGRDRILIFSTRNNLQLLQRCTQWYADGTFKVTPPLFTQMYTIHGEQFGRVHPLVYALLPDKRETTYDRLLFALQGLMPNLNPQRILTDIERAAINAIQNAFPYAQTSGCFFHMSQAIWLKIQELGLAQLYSASIRLFGLRKPAYENGCGGDSGSSRSESPLMATPSSVRVPSPQNNGNLGRIGPQNAAPFLNRTPSSKFPGQMDGATAMDVNGGGGLMAGMKRSQISVCLQPPPQNGGFYGSAPGISGVGLKETVSDYSLQQSSVPLVQAVRSKKVERPVAQSAVSPATVVSVTVAAGPSSTAQSPISSATPIAAHGLPPAANYRHQPPQQHYPHQTKVLSAKLDLDAVSGLRLDIQPNQTADGGSCLNYKLEASARDSGEPLFSAQTRGVDPSMKEVQRITVEDLFLDPAVPLDPNVPSDKRYIEDLCRRVSNLLRPRQSSLGKRDSTASSASESGTPTSAISEQGVYPSHADYTPLSQQQGRPFASILSRKMKHGRNSPVSSVSTESSTDNDGGSNVIRCESPLPESVRERLAGDGSAGTQSLDDQFVTVKPCTAKAFKFFMEQHVENVIKQHKERQMRFFQLEKEMAVADFRTPWRCQMKRLLAEKESRYLRLKRQRMDATVFAPIRTIGQGAFGEVALVRKNDTNALYAMKRLRKSEVLEKRQAAHVKAERDVLSEADNEWVVKLYYSFQDARHLFLILEYIPGGDMMSLLIKKGTFEPPLARFYIAELVCAIESVHRLGFIHRDIKPDNILIDRNGHIKLTDFGLCTGLRWTHDNKYYHRQLDKPWIQAARHERQDSEEGSQKLLQKRNTTREKAWSLVGTPNYIAPEVLNQDKGHTQLCDWWSVGVILYEMVVGQPPFLANTPQETTQKVINWRQTLRIPVRLPDATEDLILRLCRDAADRLGPDHIKQHPFFHGLDFDSLRLSRAPYIPEILHETDTSNFDPIEPREDQPPQGPKSGGEHAFYEFTFRRFFDSDPMGCPTIRRTAPRPSLGPLIESTGYCGNGDEKATSDSASSSSTLVAPNHAANISVLRIDTGGDSHPTDVTYYSSAAANGRGNERGSVPLDRRKREKTAGKRRKSAGKLADHDNNSDSAVYV